MRRRSLRFADCSIPMAAAAIIQGSYWIFLLAACAFTRLLEITSPQRARFQPTDEFRICGN